MLVFRSVLLFAVAVCCLVSCKPIEEKTLSGIWTCVSIETNGKVQNMPLLISFEKEKFEMRTYREYNEKGIYSQKGPYKISDEFLILKFTETRSDTLTVVKNSKDSLILMAPGSGAKIVFVPLPKFANGEKEDRLITLLINNIFQVSRTNEPENNVIEFLDKKEFINLDSFKNFLKREKTFYAIDNFKNELFIILDPTKLVHIKEISDNLFSGNIQDFNNSEITFSGFSIESRNRIEKIQGLWKSDSLDLVFTPDSIIEMEAGKKHSYLWKFNNTEDIVQMRLPEINKTLKEIRVINLEKKTLEIERFNYFSDTIEKLKMKKQ